MEAFEPGAPGKPTIHDAAVAVTKAKVLRFLTHPAVNLIQPTCIGGVVVGALIDENYCDRSNLSLDFGWLYAAHC